MARIRQLNKNDRLTASQIIDAIDRGEAGDKVVGHDLAAVPLGTDDEAAGKPPTERELEVEVESLRKGIERRSRTTKEKRFEVHKHVLKVYSELRFTIYISLLLTASLLLFAVIAFS